MTTLERAARALCDLEGVNPGKAVILNVREDSGTTHVTTELRWRAKMPMVRAVLTAIREPGEAMQEKGWVAFNDATLGGGPVTRPTETGWVWSAMIDAMLEEG